MDGDGPFRVLADVEELPEDGVVRRAPVHKEQVVVLEAGFGEAPGVVHLLVESDDRGDVVVPEVRDVGLGSVQRVAWGGEAQEVRRVLIKATLEKKKDAPSLTVLYFALRMRPTEREELPRNDPVQISVFCPLIVLVFFHVEVGEVEPAVLKSLRDGDEREGQREVISIMAQHNGEET